MPVLLDPLVPPLASLLLAISLVIIFGETLPQAEITPRDPVPGDPIPRDPIPGSHCGRPSHLRHVAPQAAGVGSSRITKVSVIAQLVPLIQLLMCISYPIAKPLACILDGKAPHAVHPGPLRLVSPSAERPRLF